MMESNRKFYETRACAGVPTADLRPGMLAELLAQDANNRRQISEIAKALNGEATYQRSLTEKVQEVIDARNRLQEQASEMITRIERLQEGNERLREIAASSLLNGEAS